MNQYKKDNQKGFASIAIALFAIGAAFLVGEGIVIRQKLVPRIDQEKKSRYERLIVVKPRAGDVVKSGFEIEGTAWGWFEGNVPIRVVDSNGTVLYKKSLTVGDNYERPAYFYKKIDLDFQPTATSGMVIFEDYSAKDGSLIFSKEIKIGFEKVVENAVRKVQVFYYNRMKDSDVICETESVLPVLRTIPISNTPIQDTINVLLKGELSKDEAQQGYETEFPLSGFNLLGASLKNGVLILEFEDLGNQTNGGACRVNLLRAEVRKTAAQFPEVKEVRLLPETLFQP